MQMPAQQTLREYQPLAPEGDSYMDKNKYKRYSVSYSISFQTKIIHNDKNIAA